MSDWRQPTDEDTRRRRGMTFAIVVAIVVVAVVALVVLAGLAVLVAMLQYG
ncbi:MAG: hypothetical protein ACHQZR_00410 [Candidatus Limnocylindrales bacterium]